MTTDKLLDSIRAKDAAGVVSALSMGAAVNSVDEHGWTSLCWAAGAGHAGIVRLLQAHGADSTLCGQDGRTPVQIALAAGHLEAARVLAAEGSAWECGSPGRDRPYCQGFRLAELRSFPRWNDRASHASAETAEENADPVVFLHRDFTVTRSIWPGEAILFDDVTDDWRAFCTARLGFAPPVDFDLLAARRDG